MTEQVHQLEYANAAARGVLGMTPRQRGTVAQLVMGLIETLLWFVITSVVVAGLMFILAALTGASFVGPGSILVIVLIPMYALTRRKIRRRRGLAVLGYVRQAVRLNLPIHRVLLTAAASETGKVAARLRDLNEALFTGATISTSLAATVPELSPRAIGMILLGEQTGRLSEALDRVMGDAVKKSHSATDSNVIILWYVPAALAIACGVISMIAIFIAPKFHRIMNDFKVPVPPLLVAMEWTVDWLFYFVPLLVFTILCALGLRLREAVTGRGNIAIFGRIADRVMWYMPISHGLESDRALGDVFLALADAVEAGYPLDQVLVRTTQLDVNIIVQNRLAHWADAIGKGAAPADAARLAKMPALLVGLLKTASANPADVFRFAGRFYHTRSVDRRELLGALYLPLSTVLLGLVVLFVALAVFQPMQTLIQVSGPKWYGP